MLEYIVSLMTLCQTSISLGKTLKQWKASELTAREKELLIAASEPGTFQIMLSDHTGLFVVAGMRDFADTDPAITAHYFDAFTKLCDRGLVTHMREDMFRLTGHGFDLARMLAQKS